MPLSERCSTLVPQCGLAEGAREIVRKWKESGEAFTQQIVRQVELEDQQRRFHNDYLMSAGESIPIEETGTKINISDRSLDAPRSLRIGKGRKSSKILKRLLPGRKDSRTASSSANTNNRDMPPKRLSSVSVASIASIQNPYVRKNSQGQGPNRDSANQPQDNGVLLTENGHVQKNQGLKPEDSTNKPQLNGVLGDDHAYQCFLECINGTQPAEPLLEEPPEAAPEREQDDSFESFLELLGAKDDSKEQ